MPWVVSVAGLRRPLKAFSQKFGRGQRPLGFPLIIRDTSAQKIQMSSLPMILAEKHRFIPAAFD
jgi:hypothetical protein